MPRKSAVSVGTAKRSNGSGSKSNGRRDSSESSEALANGDTAPQQHDPIKLADGTEVSNHMTAAYHTLRAISWGIKF